ncbi:MAG: hypothetical protein KDC48_01330 [Planctomycetes bacterium]|nr:hypothetical protein [Planctomycetota bacterium]
MERCLIGGAVTLLLGGMAASSWTQRGVIGLRQQLQQFVAEVDAQELATQCRHDAVWGETREQRARPHYQAAARLQEACSRFCWNDAKGAAMADNRELTGDELAALREQWRPVCEAVGEGAHSRDRTLLGGPFPWMQLGWGVSAEVRARLAEGEELAAVQLWLDVMTMRADLEESSSGFFWAGHLIDLWDDARLAKLGDAARALLDGGLQLLEHRVDVTPSPTQTIAAYLRPLLDGSRARRGWSLRERLWAWQSCMDPEHRHLEGFDELIAAAPLLAPPATSFSARQAQWAQFDASPRSMSTYVSCRADEGIRDLEKIRRGTLTSMRLLRLAIAFHAGAELPELLDPFADAPLRASGDDERMLLVSAGGAKRYVHRVR